MSNPALSQPLDGTRAYAPKGVDKRRVPIALMPKERKDLEDLAFKDGRSLAAMGRVIFLRGLQAIAQEQSSTS
jgi:hypothetical protein